MKYSNYGLVADVSRKVGGVTAADLSGFDAVIVRMGGSENPPNSPPYSGYVAPYNPYFDDAFEMNVQAAYDAPNSDGKTGIPCGASFVVGPRAFTEVGIDSEDYGSVPNERHPVMSIMLRKLRAGSSWKAVHFLMLIIDDSSLNMSGGYKVTSLDLKAYIEDFRERVVALRRAAEFPNIPIGFYSRKSLIDQIDPDGSANPHVRTWFENHPGFFLATANFPNVSGSAPNAETIRARFLPADTANPIPWGYSPAREKADAEYPLWTFWNYANPGRVHRFGVHLYNGTRVQLWNWLKFRQTENPPPPVVIPPKDWDAINRIIAIENRLAEIAPILDRADRHLAK